MRLHTSRSAGIKGYPRRLYFGWDELLVYDTTTMFHVMRTPFQLIHPQQHRQPCSK